MGAKNSALGPNPMTATETANLGLSGMVAVCRATSVIKLYIRALLAE